MSAPRLRKGCRRLAPLAAVMLLAGCVSTVRYPAQWAKPVGPQPDCAHLSGLYENAGTRVEPAWVVGSKASTTGATLAPLLFARSGEGFAGASRVRLDAADPTRLAVTAIDPDGSSHAVVLEGAKDEFACRAGSIVLGEGKFAAASIALLGGRETCRLSRAADGALIVDEHAWGVGTAMLVLPVGFSGRSYARFAPAADAPAAPLPAAPR